MNDNTTTTPLTRLELAAILDAHRRWATGEPDGERADLHGANLHGANLHYANLRYANLHYANLTGANLHYADMRYANLHGANLTDANLTDAYLNGANLHGANLTDADLGGTCVRLILDNDGRDYSVIAHGGLTSDGEPIYLAGCRTFTIAGARKHWSNPNHDNHKAAARILAAIETHHTAWETQQ